MIILPKTFIPEGSLFKPVFFLAGPIRGGGDWQRQACHLLLVSNSVCTVVIPCQYERDDPLYKSQSYGIASNFPRQTRWERHYLELAGRLGCIIFWLPAPQPDFVPQPGHSYARDTRGELGEWRTQLYYQPRLRVVFGAEADFPGLSVFEANLHDQLGSDFPIHTTLPETVAAAVQRLQD